MPKQKDPNRRFKKDAMKMVRENLENALEWVDKGDTTWALTCIKTAVKLLDVVREV